METVKCLYCCKDIPAKNKSGKARRYCSTRCQADKRYELKIQNYLEGREKGWTGKTRQLCVWLRRYIFEQRGVSCCKCHWNMKHPDDGKVLTEINHIDGDAENCKLSNLEVLCPNCHSMTSNYRARNKSSKRER